jgi:DNA-directed RNA polymerase specialized sigma24 family protein
VKSPPNYSSALTKNNHALRTIFNQYGSALLGYIFGVVNDHVKAENYLVEIFKLISRYADELIRPGVNTWLRLQQLAKNFLYKSTQPALSSVDTKFVASEQSNKCLNLLTAEQKHIFCNIYYGHKSVQALAQEMRKDENEIRRCLREALSVIRNGQ